MITSTTSSSLSRGLERLAVEHAVVDREPVGPLGAERPVHGRDDEPVVFLNLAWCSEWYEIGLLASNVESRVDRIGQSSAFAWPTMFPTQCTARKKSQPPAPSRSKRASTIAGTSIAVVHPIASSGCIERPDIGVVTTDS